MVETRRIDSITQGYCKEKSSGIMTRYQLLKSHGDNGGTHKEDREESSKAQRDDKRIREGKGHCTWQTVLLKHKKRATLH